MISLAATCRPVPITVFPTLRQFEHHNYENHNYENHNYENYNYENYNYENHNHDHHNYENHNRKRHNPLSQVTMSNIGPPVLLRGASEFQCLRTYTDLPDQLKAEKLLRTLAIITRPAMKRHHLSIPVLSELLPSRDWNADNMIGPPGEVPQKDKYGYYKSIGIRIKLRDEHDPTKFLSLEYLLGIMCHELAHCWHADHEMSFIEQ
jgi:hypothetical protein